MTLPENCGITPDDIPTNIGYHCENGGKTLYFDVDIKMGGKRVYRRKTTKCQNISLLKKLDLTKELLKDVMKERPELFKDRCLNGHLSEEGDELYESYFAILEKAKIEDPFHEYVSAEERNKEFM